MHMWISLLVALSFVILSSGQPHPTISETFAARVEVERDTRGEIHRGAGDICRDQINKKGLEAYNITLGNNTNDEVVYSLERYDLDPPMEYHIRGVSKDPHLHCSEERPHDPEFQPFFGWLAEAKDLGTMEIKDLRVHAYGIENGGIRLLLGVDPEDSAKPMILERGTPGEQIYIIFKTFSTTVDPRVFDIPEMCRRPPPK
ncbi:PREDICTED: uncharacterized protein LOC109580256 [Amphimedon queenslandica]|uniref:Uncharacterized protein n=1 Tax=Amphimedon queenslandica TaxID=400682 RepID=A0A1X7VHT3_AMPQE|nr:PREDICTED: uncharacterized protein LOC109580256 [Amphimedon queenslandica]|eukprot:XP_019848813.1 PREDICTED: uncharacterized protein LOC109580256 [Amphimedon queenslandica]